MEFASYNPLWWLVLLLALGAGLWFSLVDRPSRLKYASFGLRALGVFLLILTLCRPFWKDRSTDLHVIFLADVSQSVDLKAVEGAIDGVSSAITKLRSGDSWSLYAVADGARPFESPEKLKEVLQQWQKGIADDQFRSASQLAGAMLNTRMTFPAGKARRFVLITDGQETDTELAPVMDLLAKEQSDVRFEKVSGLERAEAAVVSVEPSNQNAYQGEMVRMKVKVAANQPCPARLRILHKGIAVMEREVKLEAKPDNVFNLDVEMTTPGASVWSVELQPKEDYFPINNQLGAIVNVTGKPRLLFVHQEPNELRPIARALKEQDFEVDVRGKHGLPETMDELLAFDAIVLADVPATDLTVRQMELLQKYVADFGGGLVMMGSENSFGLGGYYKTPVEEVLPLISRFEKEKEKPSLAMALVIDKSGSMGGVPIALARQAAKAVVELLSQRDQIAVIGFDSNPQVVCEMRSAAERDAIQSAIDSLEAGGGTDCYPAMVVARDMLEAAPAKVKHMILLSDGQTPQADHLGLTQAMVDSGITVSTVALGDGAARELMSSIAEVGKGRFYETADPASVPQIFTKETMQASKSAIKEDLYGVVQTGDHPILSGYEQTDLPFALGYVMTESKPTAQVLLVAETGDPLLAISRFGLGTGMAYTSDLSEKWGGEWLAWDDCGKFWAQAFRGVVRKSDTEGVQTTVRESGGKWIVDIMRRAPDRKPVSRITWDALVMRDEGKATAVPVIETGLGRYRAEVPLEDAKRLSLRLHDRDHDKLKVQHYAARYPAEYNLSREVPPALAGLTTFQPDGIRADLQPVSRHRPVQSWFSLAALACLMAGVLLRRI